MSNYYAIAKNEAGKDIIVTHETFTDRITARIETERAAKAQKLTDVDVRMVQGQKKQGSTLTKFNQYRKRNNNEMPKEYYGAF